MATTYGDALFLHMTQKGLTYNKKKDCHKMTVLSFV